MAIHEVFTYLRVRNATKAIEFYKATFGATEKMRLVEPSGRIGHAELDLGNTTIMISDEYPEYEILGPEGIGGTSFSIHLHVDDADALIATAIKAGATLVREPRDQFYGERSGSIRDPFGHEWIIGHSLEELTAEEMQRRYDKIMASGEEKW